MLIYITEVNEEPQVKFLSIPQRQDVGFASFPGSTKQVMFMHPQGKYLAVQNMYTKSSK
jgi:hypothetical protein